MKTAALRLGAVRVQRKAVLRVGVLVALCGLAAGAAGQNVTTRIVFEVSDNDGLSWSNVLAYLPGTTYQVRGRVQLNGTPAGVMGLAGLTWQPTLTGFTPVTDQRVAFTNEATGGGVDYAPGTQSLGRINPFASSGMRSSSASGLLTSFEDPGGVLRFAGSNAAMMTTHLPWGVASVQLPREYAGTRFNSSFDVVVFKYAVTLNSIPADEFRASVSQASIFLGRASWYTLDSGLDPYYSSVSEIVDARIVIPGPWGACVLAGGVVFRRRRKR